ncbi:MAG: hypothetical protein ACFCUR_02495 [Rhodomicrobiaceae bacterium]
MTARRLFAAVVATIVLAGAATAQPQKCDESWEVDKKALSRVFADMSQYLAGPDPVVINLNELGATSGQLVIVFAKKNLQCAERVYGAEVSGAASGTIEICKRPQC